MMERQVEHLVRLVDDLLEVSRVSHGKIELRKERLDLAVVVNRAVDLNRELIDAAGVLLRVILPDAPVLVDARNIWRPAEVVHAGLQYQGIGVPSVH